jgi:hypothetical protein
MLMNFPTLCVDNFYKDPDSIRQFALSLDYQKPPSGQYPGKRTDALHGIDRTFFDAFCEKLFSIYYDFLTPIDWVVNTSFQLINPMSDSENNAKNTGWIHTDYRKDGDPIFAGIIYLTPDINPKCGTSIFKINEKSKFFGPHIEEIEQVKRKFYLSGVDDDYDNVLKATNDCFTETARFDNIYNRLVSFDAKTFHAANNFYTEGQPRLTQVFFVHSLTTESRYPLDRCYSSKL